MIYQFLFTLQSLLYLEQLAGLLILLNKEQITSLLGLLQSIQDLNQDLIFLCLKEKQEEAPLNFDTAIVNMFKNKNDLFPIYV